MKWILASVLTLAICGCEPMPLKRVTLYRADGVTQYWNTRYTFIDDGFVTFDEEETGDRVHVSGNITVEVERNAEKP